MKTTAVAAQRSEYWNKYRRSFGYGTPCFEVPNQSYVTQKSFRPSSELKTRVEDVLFNRREDATERLVEIAEEYRRADLDNLTELESLEKEMELGQQLRHQGFATYWR